MSKDLRSHAIDPVDGAIINRLQAGGRASFAEIGKEVGLSATSVAERIRRLEHSGIIQGYYARLAAAKLGYPLTAFILARPIGPDARFVKVAGERSEIIECHRVTGDVSFIVRAVVTDVQHLEEVLNHLEPATSYVVTLVVLSTAFEARPLAVNAARPV